MRYSTRKVSIEGSFVGLQNICEDETDIVQEDAHRNLTFIRYKMWQLLPMKNIFIMVLYSETHSPKTRSR